MAASRDHQRIEMEARRIEIQSKLEQIEAKRQMSEDAYRRQISRSRRLLISVASFVLVLLAAGVGQAIYAARKSTELAKLGRLIEERELERSQAERDYEKQVAMNEELAEEHRKTESARQETVKQLEGKVKQEETLLAEVKAAGNSLFALEKQLLASKRDVRRLMGETSDLKLELAACQGDLTTRSQELAKCQINLTTRTQDLTNCRSFLTTCEGDLTTRSQDLKNCRNTLATCPSDLTTCQGNLTTCQGDLTTRSQDRATCQGLLASCPANLTSCNATMAKCPASLAACSESQKKCIASAFAKPEGTANFSCI